MDADRLGSLAAFLRPVTRSFPEGPGSFRKVVDFRSFPRREGRSGSRTRRSVARSLREVPRLLGSGSSSSAKLASFRPSILRILASRCRFATPWDQLLRRVMGPGRRINSTEEEGASYRLRGRSIFRCSAPPVGLDRWAGGDGCEGTGHRLFDRGCTLALGTGDSGGGSAESSFGLSRDR